MAITLSERLISLAQAAKLVPSNYNSTVSPATVWRWASKGIRAADGRVVKLEAIRVGGRMITSSEAVQRFVDRLNGPVEVDLAVRSPAERTRASERAARKLEEAGI